MWVCKHLCVLSTWLWQLWIWLCTFIFLSVRHRNRGLAASFTRSSHVRKPLSVRCDDRREALTMNGALQIKKINKNAAIVSEAMSRISAGVWGQNAARNSLSMKKQICHIFSYWQNQNPNSFFYTIKEHLEFITTKCMVRALQRQLRGETTTYMLTVWVFPKRWLCIRIKSTTVVFTLKPERIWLISPTTEECSAWRLNSLVNPERMRWYMCEHTAHLWCTSCWLCLVLLIDWKLVNRQF